MDQHLHNWDDYLQTSVLGYNTSVQASTKYSPFYLMYNQDPRMGDPKDAASMQQLELTAQIHEARNQANMATTSTAIANMSMAQEKQKRDDNSRRPMDPQLPDTNTLVLVKMHGKGKKLEHNVEGPYKLKAYNTDHTLVQLEDATGKTWTEYSSFISPFTDHTQPSSSTKEPCRTSRQSKPSRKTQSQDA
jgi:hypothetical protein